MKKTLVCALTFLVIVAASILGSPDLANAKPVFVQEPQNKVYSERTVPLVFSYTTPTYPYSTVSLGGFSYILDRGPEVPINPRADGSTYATTISGLADGTHSLLVHIQVVLTSLVGPGPPTAIWLSSDLIEFAVNAAEPNIQILSINPTRLETYNGTEVPLVFRVNEAASWMGYSLDNLTAVTISGNTSLTGLSKGLHSLVVYANDTFGMLGVSPVACFRVELQQEPTPTSTSTFTAGLSESASALNYGNTINFTVTAEGGTAPYTYKWYIDDQLVEISNSPYYLTNTQTVGPHHIYVQVTDADGNTAQTLSPEFNVLPTSSPSLSPSPTQQPTPTPENNQAGEFTTALILCVVVVAAVAVGALVYLRRGKAAFE